MLARLPAGCFFFFLWVSNVSTPLGIKPTHIRRGKFCVHRYIFSTYHAIPGRAKTKKTMIAINQSSPIDANNSLPNQTGRNKSFIFYTPALLNTTYSSYRLLRIQKLIICYPLITASATGNQFFAGKLLRFRTGRGFGVLKWLNPPSLGLCYM